MVERPAGEDLVQATINYVVRSGERMRFFANDHSRDTVVIDPKPMPLIDARGAGTTLDRGGFELIGHRSAVPDFTDAAAVAAVHPAEIAALIQRLTGAGHVSVTGVGVLRFAERSALSGKLDNSLPARFAHVDVSDATAVQFSARSAPEGRGVRRSAQYNVWRAIFSRRMRSSIGRASRTGRSRLGWSRTIRRIAGTGSAHSTATRRWCSRPGTAMLRRRIACRTWRSTTPTARKTPFRARASRCARSRTGSTRLNPPGRS